MPISFKEYVRKAKVTNSPTGDFMAAAKRDPAIGNVDSLEKLRAFASTNTGHAPAIAADVWRNYRSFLRRASARLV